MGVYWQEDYKNWLKAQEKNGKFKDFVLKEYEDGSFDVFLTANNQRQLLSFPTDANTGFLTVLGNDKS